MDTRAFKSDHEHLPRQRRARAVARGWLLLALIGATLACSDYAPTCTGGSRCDDTQDASDEASADEASADEASADEASVDAPPDDTAASCLAPAATGSCRAGLSCGDGVCCAAAAPFFCATTGQCYATAEEASAACGPASCVACVADTAARCGDGTCSGDESAATCCDDCGCAPGASCIAGTCQIRAAQCGNGRCESGETSATCCADCPCSSGQTCMGNTCVTPAACGNGRCESGETSATCCADCPCPGGQTCRGNTCVTPTVCGNGRCEPGETSATCCADCPCATGSVCSAGACRPQIQVTCASNPAPGNQFCSCRADRTATSGVATYSGTCGPGTDSNRYCCLDGNILGGGTCACYTRGGSVWTCNQVPGDYCGCSYRATSTGMSNACDALPDSLGRRWFCCASAAENTCYCQRAVPGSTACLAGTRSVTDCSRPPSDFVPGRSSCRSGTTTVSTCSPGGNRCTSNRDCPGGCSTGTPTCCNICNSAGRCEYYCA